MLPRERHRLILSNLAEHGSVRTGELADRLEVTDETIRRDLEALERQGRLQRTHGGAVRLARDHSDLPLTTREVQNIAQKQAAARAARALIAPGEVIYLDASTTALQMAPLLADVAVTVITHAQRVMVALAGFPGLRLIALGGELDRDSLSYLGPATVAGALRYGIDKMFFSGNGLDAHRGVSEGNAQQAALKEAILEHAGEAYFLGDETKLNRASSYYFAPVKRLAGALIGCGEPGLSASPFQEAGLALHFYPTVVVTEVHE